MLMWLTFSCPYVNQLNRREGHLESRMSYITYNHMICLNVYGNNLSTFSTIWSLTSILVCWVAEVQAGSIFLIARSSCLSFWSVKTWCLSPQAFLSSCSRDLNVFLSQAWKTKQKFEMSSFSKSLLYGPRIFLQIESIRYMRASIPSGLTLFNLSSITETTALALFTSSLEIFVRV